MTYDGGQLLMMGNFMVRDRGGVLTLLTVQVALGNHFEAVVRSPGTWQHGIQGFEQLKKAEKGQKRAKNALLSFSASKLT